MGERLTFYSLIANVILFAKSHLGYEDVDATTINQVFAGIVYIVPIGGGFIADSYAGRFKTIVTSAIIYPIGIVFILAAAIDFSDWGAEDVSESGKRGLFLTGLSLIAIGSGGIKANVGPFGAEQMEPLGKDAIKSFFNWFYWVINVGAFMAFTGVSYVQQEVSFVWGYFIPLITMVLSLIIFVSVQSKYLQTEPKGSILSTAFSICDQGCCKEPPEPNPELPEGSENEMLARAKISFGGRHQDHLVNGVVSVIKVIPFCVLFILYWTVCFQLSNTYFVQGTRMDVRLGDGINVPVAAINISNTFIIIILIPVVDRCLYPFMQRIGKPLSYLKRIGIGMILAALSLFIAGYVEIERKELMKEPGGTHIQVLAGKEYNASSLSIFAQVPQFALVGISEIFASITGLEFAYNQAPVAMQGVLTGLFLASAGFGNFLSTALLLIVKDATENDPWWGDEINDVKMENLLFLLGGLMLTNVLVFCIVAHFYSYQDPNKFEEDYDDDEEDEEEDMDRDASLTKVDENRRRAPGETTRLNSNHYGNIKSYTTNLPFDQSQ